MIPNSHKIVSKRFVNEDHTREEEAQFHPILIDDQTPDDDIWLCLDIEEALCEKDILLLRSKLKNINDKTGITSSNEHSMDAEAYFGLSEELFNPVKLNVDCEELEIKNYLQKLHIKNHAVVSKEVIHDLFTEETGIVEIDHQLMSAEDELLFEEIRDAVAEKEIVDLRANLQSIAQSVSIHERTFEEIEDLIDGELDSEIEITIREEAKVNASLSFEIDLHSEVNSAIEELDIMKLRANLKEMMQNEYSHSRTVEEIDSYLNDDLDEQTMALFDEEFINNSDLAEDLAFHKEVDKAIAESDIMALRANLKNISQNQQDMASEKLGVVSPKKANLFWYSAASIILLMVVFGSLLRQKTYSNQQIYTSYYQPYKSGESVSRSSLASNNILNTALREIDQGHYSSALKLLESASATELDGFSLNFYSGVVYQETGEYNRAINSFSKVVLDGDNLLVEQSEWYIGLCYLKIDEREKALAQFKAIISRKGFYGEQSRKLLRQLE